MKMIKFDGTIGIMCAKIKKLKGIFFCVKEDCGIKKPFGKPDKRYNKGKSIRLMNCDVVFKFVNIKSIDNIIKVLNNCKEELQ